MGFYAILLAASLWLNKRDGKMLLLTLSVGSGIFSLMLFPNISNEDFYLVCIAVEIIVLLMADITDCNASRIIMGLSTTLIALHCVGIFLDGSRPDSPYHVLVVFCEYAEILACILLSEPFIKIGMKNA